MLMFSHSVFSLPFALVSLVVASRWRPGAWTVFWVLVAFLGARNSANALNRVIDRDLDGRNPRTRDRHLPAGTLSSAEVWLIAASSFGLLVLAAFKLKPLCVYLLPVAGLLFFVYSFTKRFTWLCHLFLGATCAGAPVGAWIAATGRIEFPALVLGAANALWVAGFDVIYGAQDEDFDVRNGIHSIPARFGIPLALLISSAFHALTVAFLLFFGFLAGFGPVYYLGILVVAVLLFWEHRMVRARTTSSM